jgi:hypothetical protein
MYYEILHTFGYFMRMILLGMYIFLMKNSKTFEGKDNNKLHKIGNSFINFGCIIYNSLIIFTLRLRSAFFIMFAS